MKSLKAEKHSLPDIMKALSDIFKISSLYRVTLSGQTDPERPG
jgi:hypothetical protein